MGFQRNTNPADWQDCNWLIFKIQGGLWGKSNAIYPRYNELIPNLLFLGRY